MPPPLPLLQPWHGEGLICRCEAKCRHDDRTLPERGGGADRLSGAAVTGDPVVSWTTVHPEHLYTRLLWFSPEGNVV